MLDIVMQAAIAVTGGVAIALLACENPMVSRWGWLFGAMGAPVWLYVTWPFSGDASSWGIFALSVCYAVNWGRGLWTFLLKRRSR